MASSAQATIANTATAIGSASADEFLVLRNRSSVSIFIGGSAVTTGTGFELLPGEAVSPRVLSRDRLYGIVASGTARLDVLGSSAA